MKKTAIFPLIFLSLLHAEPITTETEVILNECGQELQFFEKFCSEDERPFFAIEWIYLQPSGNFPSYGVYLPESSSSKTHLKQIDQSYSYKSGFRLSAMLPCFHQEWQIGIDWMRYHPSFSKSREDDAQFSTVANYVIPSLGYFGNERVNSVEGMWKLHLDSWDLILRKSLCMRCFTISPLAGVKVGRIHQTLNVRYGDFEIVDYRDKTPRSFQGKSEFTGIGPLIGLELCYWLQHNLHVFFKGNISGVTGRFKNTTNFQNLLHLSEDARDILTRKKTTISEVKHWKIGLEWTPQIRSIAFRLTAGWEGLIWGGGIEIPTKSTLLQTPSESNLSLFGPFFQASLIF